MARKTGIHAIALASALSATAVANAQVTTFEYRGTVVETSGDVTRAGLPAFGDDANGTFTLDLDNTGGFFVLGPDGQPINLGLNFYQALDLTVQVNDTLLDSPANPLALVGDNSATGDGSTFAFNPTNPDPGLLDQLTISTTLTDGQQPIGVVTVDFIGERTWFDGLNLPDPETIGLENVIAASVTIEFRDQPAPGFDDNGFPIIPDPSETETTGKVVIELDSVASNGTIIATIGCRVASTAYPPAVTDEQDVRGFVKGYVSNDPSADFDFDGAATPQDVELFVDNYVTCGKAKTETNPLGMAFSPTRLAPKFARGARTFFEAHERGSMRTDINRDGTLDARDLALYLEILLSRF